MAPDMVYRSRNTFFTGDGIKLAWSQRLILMLSFFFIWKFAMRSADQSAEPREKQASGQDR